ncbi:MULTISPECIES: sigma-70 family RNA polymerase sigma factor [unclassified Agarivorans]|uniref:sigma-70 family RNA polymerase sigma factor n=1 Tax=unclassified Agarivorans TaxID=2636026 RepID=UPI003D7F06FF
MSLASDEQLMLDYGQRGDLAAFECLYQRYRKALFAFVRQKMPETAANEVFQDIWESLISQASSFHLMVTSEAGVSVYAGCEGKFRAFLYTIARRRIADHWRRQGGQGEQDEQALAGLLATTNPELSHQQAQAKQVILLCVSRLPRKQQDVFMLKQNGLAVAEISVVLDASFDAVKSRIRTAYQQLRECWEKHHG